MSVAKFLTDDQIEQVQMLCNQAASGPKDKPAYVTIEIINNHPRDFQVTVSVKPIVPPEVQERYANRKSRL